MVLNKWIQFGLSALVALLGFAASFDWTTLVSVKTAGVILGVIGVFKMLMNALAPAVSQPTVTSTGNPVITHT